MTSTTVKCIIAEDDFVALGPTLQIVATDFSRQRTKEKAISLGVDSPLVVRASRIRIPYKSFDTEDLAVLRGAELHAAGRKSKIVISPDRRNIVAVIDDGPLEKK